ncbi:Protein of unknown function [Propionibacterium freudenreichii]|uniref:Uncharacterized protein n=1 Tax=Propionibacterium freudenreichii subsp. freudenreichii TaxID=66712 RepID=A0A0B7NT25_PROFF|nr:Protein of unknown function [Propionibacterium freudenreichii]CEP25851.1 Protein of unknown function [Propionibacterium freudenreichii subsp. freudenreichii]CEG89958.1 Protein of unknown function [Propionibacterium freudenreichii]CEG95203.1 Protein of unknown function [Propionibacterium freudenreichii]CEH06714.1 Protein of unknown function [Propionibacterium freudenreichii]
MRRLRLSDEPARSLTADSP